MHKKKPNRYYCFSYKIIPIFPFNSSTVVLESFFTFDQTPKYQLDQIYKQKPPLNFKTEAFLLPR